MSQSDSGAIRASGTAEGLFLGLGLVGATTEFTEFTEFTEEHGGFPFQTLWISVTSVVNPGLLRYIDPAVVGLSVP